MSFRVFGVVMHDGQAPATLPEGVRRIAVRDLGAVVEEGEFPARAIEPADVQRHGDVIAALFAVDAVLPAPVGTVFRTEEALQRWIELHYVALSDALAWVENRVAARVHVTRARPSRDINREAGSDHAAIAAEVARSLRRHAVSTVGLRTEEIAGVVITSAYLVERELWQEFADAVEDERDKHPHVKLELSGPWPPYDFVKMQFGA